jgi:WD40 repeat protein
VKTYRGHTDWVTSVAFSKDGAFLVSGGGDRVIKVWDIRLACAWRRKSGYGLAGLTPGFWSKSGLVCEPGRARIALDGDTSAKVLSSCRPIRLQRIGHFSLIFRLAGIKKDMGKIRK